MTPFSLDVRGPCRGVTVVRPRGELDLATAPELAAWLDDLRIARADVVLDLSAVEFLDSAGLRVIVDARARAERHRTGLALRDPSDAVGRTCRAAGVGLAQPAMP